MRVSVITNNHEIHKSFDCNPLVDARGTLLDISEDFNKVWYEGLLFKLRSSGVEGDLLKPTFSSETGSFNWLNFFLEKSFFWYFLKALFLDLVYS